MKGLPQEVVMECLALREQRSNIDLVADVTESQLQKVCAYLRMYIVHVHVQCTLQLCGLKVHVCACTYTYYIHVHNTHTYLHLHMYVQCLGSC